MNYFCFTFNKANVDTSIEKYMTMIKEADEKEPLEKLLLSTIRMDIKGDKISVCFSQLARYSQSSRDIYNINVYVYEGNEAIKIFERSSFTMIEDSIYSELSVFLKILSKKMAGKEMKVEIVKTFNDFPIKYKQTFDIINLSSLKCFPTSKIKNYILKKMSGSPIEEKEISVY